MSIRILTYMCACLCLASCQKNAAKTPQKNVPVPTLEFSADSAYNYVQAQVDFGPRVPNTPAHAACADYLADALTRFGAQVIRQNADVQRYDGQVLHICNLVGSYKPEAEQRVLLCAHWDTRPWADHDAQADLHHTPVLGANDGASGVGVLLEIARQLGHVPPQVGVDILFFDAEDCGTPDFEQKNYGEDTWCLGTQYWAKNPHVAGYKAEYGILLDMVGAPDAKFAREYFSMQYAPDVLARVWKNARALGFSNWFSDKQVYPITDDHYYVNTIAKIPCIDIIHYNADGQTGFADYWHTTHDDMDNISKSTLEAVGKTVLATIRSEQ